MNAKWKQWKSSAEILEQYWVPVETVEFLKTPEWRKAYWVYSEWKVKLAEQLKEWTAPHETLHAVFDLVDNVRKKSLIKEIMKEKNISESQANEFIADSFSEYFRTWKMPWTSWFRWWVKSFFQR